MKIQVIYEIKTDGSRNRENKNKKTSAREALAEVKNENSGSIFLYNLWSAKRLFLASFQYLFAPETSPYIKEISARLSMQDEEDKFLQKLSAGSTSVINSIALCQ